MLKEERFKKLLKLLEEREFCTVEYLSEVLNVSMPTIRRDLSELVNRGLIIRSHGGAMHMPLEEIPYPVNFRKSTHYREKASLAREAVNLEIKLDLSLMSLYNPSISVKNASFSA